MRKPLSAMQAPQSKAPAAIPSTQMKGSLHHQDSTTVTRPAATRSAPASARREQAPQQGSHPQISVREQKTSSSSTSSTQTTVDHHARDQAQHTKERLRSVSPTAHLNDEEERQRSALQAEFKRQSAATPSRAIAARLALERFDMRIRQRDGRAASAESRAQTSAVALSSSMQQQQQREGGSNRAALTAFAIAAAKKNSPKRMPTRVPLSSSQNAQSKQLEATQMTATSSAKGSATAQRFIRSTSDDNLAKKPDVFESRPIGSTAGQGGDNGPQRVFASHSSARSAMAAPKKASSTLARSMGAREQVLGSTTKKTTVASTASLSAQQQKRLAAAKLKASGYGSTWGTASPAFVEPKAVGGTVMSASPSREEMQKSERTPGEVATPRHKVAAATTPAPSTATSGQSPGHTAAEHLPLPLSAAERASTYSPPSVLLRQMALARPYKAGGESSTLHNALRPSKKM